METLVVRVTQPGQASPQPSLTAAVTKVLAHLPAFDCEFRVSSGTWRALDGSGLRVEWAAAMPAQGSSTIFIEARGDGLLICWGEVLEQGTVSEAIWGAYHAGGIEAVHALDGCFSAVIGSVERRTIEVCADLIGQRAMRVADVGESTLISPHDACLVACGLPVAFDEVSQASCFVVQHSLQARSLLQHVTGLEGNDIVSFHGAGRRTHRRLPKLEFSPRIDPRDVRAQTECRDWAIGRVVDTAKRWALSGTPLRCELTAGLDSRATLACVLATGARGQIETVTGGHEDSLDVRTAAHLAQLAHVKHMIVDESEVETHSFVQHATLRAFATNGETEAKRALAPLPRWNPDGVIRVGGASSEVFRGFFYPCMGPKGVAPKNFERVADLVIARRMRDFKTLPLHSEQTRTQLRQRLAGCFADYATLSDNGNDALDLLYLFERCAHWSAHVQRATWNKARNPLMLPSVVRALYRMPPPLGHHVEIHREVILRYFPASRWVLLNGARLIQLEGPGPLRATARFVLGATRTRVDKLRYRYFGHARPKAAGQADHFNGVLQPVIHDLFTTPSSVVSSLLGPAGAAKVLQDHAAGQSRLAWLGFGVTQELFARHLRAVAP